MNWRYDNDKIKEFYEWHVGQLYKPQKAQSNAKKLTGFSDPGG
jgi:hypothetical protein